MTRGPAARMTAALAAAALAFAGCTTMPTESAPQALRSYEERSQNMEIPEPRPDTAPDVVLRDFIAAMAHPADDYAAARAFLTGDIAGTWNPRRRSLIVEGVNVISDAGTPGDREVYTASGAVVGQLGDGGAYEQAEGTWRGEIAMVRDRSGQWRISALPDGIVMERQSFVDTHVARNLYFVDPTGNHLVPDRRWIYRGTDDGAAALLDLLRRGPRPQLARGVTSPLPASTAIEVGAIDAGPGMAIRYRGTGVAGADLELLLAAQTVWTLADAGLRGPWAIEVDGRPVLDRAEVAWTRDSPELKPFDPQRGPADRSALRVLGNGALYAIREDGAEIAESPWGAGEPYLVSAAMGIDTTGEEIYAAVARGEGATAKRSTLYLGRPGQPAARPLTGQTLTRPSWSPGAAAVWTVVDGEQVRRVGRFGESGALAAERVDIRSLESFAGEISELRIDPMGTQAAMIIEGRLVLATIVQNEGAPWALVTPREIRLPEGTVPVSLAWAPDSTILVGAWGAEAPIWRVQPDGSSNYMLPKVNLTAPIAVVAASSTRIYALDENALMELIDDQGDQQFWRPVPKVSGRAAPVTAE